MKKIAGLLIITIGNRLNAQKIKHKFVTVTQLIAMNKPKPSPTPAKISGDEPPRPVKSPKIAPVIRNSEAHTQRTSQEGKIQTDSAKPDPSGRDQ
jgi:hypothetical protein